MPVLPIPMIIALVLAVLLVHRLLTRETGTFLLGLIAVCAVQSAIIALRQYYGFEALRPVQPILASVIPAVAWIAFSEASGGKGSRQGLWLHAAGPALALLCLLIVPWLLDMLIPAAFAGYGVAMLAVLGRGENSLPNSRLESGALPLWTWRIVALSLLASAGCDVLIAYNMATGNAGYGAWVPSIVSSLSLLSLGALSLSHAIESRQEGDAENDSVSEDDHARDRQLIEKLETFVEAQRPYLDPDLTLSRLARKLTVPAKQLSAAINRVKGQNVSRYINERRIAEACKLMAGGKPVTAALFECGFNTKSNFNREFARVMGCSPSDWLRGSARQAPPEGQRSETPAG